MIPFVRYNHGERLLTHCAGLRPNWIVFRWLNFG